MAGKLTTHVLDTANGCPAAGMKITLWSVVMQHPQQRTLLKEVRTNPDGRTNEPLLIGENFKTGIYELAFEVGTYFFHKDKTLSEPYFLDVVPIRFGIADADAHYHVPLLTSPWSYSTYRGS